MSADLATAWRPFEPSRGYYIADDGGGCWWVGVASDRDHFIALLREQDGAYWELEYPYPDQRIDGALELGIVEVRELDHDEVERRHRCHTEDERGVIPLSEAAIGDLFCSEW